MRDMKSIQIQHLQSIKSAIEKKKSNHLKVEEDAQYEIWQKQIESSILKDSTIGSFDPNKILAKANKLEQEVEALKIKLKGLESISFTDDNLMIRAIDTKLFHLDPHHQSNEFEEDESEKDFHNNW